jgi:hypothetical protein
MDWQSQPRRSEDFVVAPGSSRSGGQKYTDPSLFSGMRYRVSLTFLQNACEIYMGPTGNPYYYDHFHHKSVGVDLTPEWEIKKDESTGKFYYHQEKVLHVDMGNAMLGNSDQMFHVCTLLSPL